MDLSKLPRMSKTEGQAPSTEPVPTQPLSPIPARAVAYERDDLTGGRGPAAWISIGVGLIFVFAFPHFTQWGIHVLFHTKPPSFLPITDSQTGAEIAYPKSVFFLNDLAVALFAYALVIDGIALLLWRWRVVLMLALAVTAAAVALNVYYLIKSFVDDSGFPIVSAISILFGGYMLWYQWIILTKKVPAARG